MSKLPILIVAQFAKIFEQKERTSSYTDRIFKCEKYKIYFFIGILILFLLPAKSTYATAPSFSGVTVSDVTTSSVKISWTTDVAASSTVLYGKTEELGSSKTDSTLKTSHSITLDSLSSNTTYNYALRGTDAAGDIGAGGEGTFTTAKESASATSTPKATAAPTNTPTPTPDRQPPSITFDPDFKKPFNQAPTLSGKSSDISGVNKIQYSLDNGKNWQSVDTLKSPGGKSVTFEFTPGTLDDGNYQVKVRSYDSLGNVGATQPKKMIIDRLPPQVGASLFTYGAQIIQPDKSGTFVTLPQVAWKFTSSAVGGPTVIDLMSASANLMPVTLSKNSENGLWSGTLSFPAIGTYQLKASSVDGANNKTQRTLSTIQVLPKGKISDSTQPIPDATVSVYYFEPISQKFLLWEASSYGQVNPQKSDAQGQYNLVLPFGKYYLSISAPEYKTVRSEIFEIGKSTPINSDFVLQKAQKIKLGPWLFNLPDFSDSTVRLMLKNRSTINQLPKSTLIGSEIPQVNLKSEGEDISTLSLRGKPTVLTFIYSWAPNTGQQLETLNMLSNQTEIAAYAVFSQETDSSVQIFKKRGGYTIPFLADPDGLLVPSLNLQILPTHVFLSRQGIIRKIITGVLNREELVDNVIK